MVSAQHSNSPWIYLAYIMITISYAMVDILYLRLFLILASVFFVVFAITFGNIFIDSLIFNLIFIIINLTYSIILIIHRYWKIKLEPIEERIYQRDFSRVMDRRTFKNLMKHAYLRSYSEGGQIVHDGNNFTSLYYVALLNPQYNISYQKKGVFYHNVMENSWIGVVEFVSYERNKKRAKKLGHNIEALERMQKEEKVKYALTAILMKNEGDVQISNDKIYEEYDEPCYVYEFSLRDLNKLFSVKDNGQVLKNSLYTVWLSYITKAITKIDEKVLDVIKKKKIFDDNEGRQEAILVIEENNSRNVSLADVRVLPDDNAAQHIEFMKIE